jgi:hypothetical protein
MWCGCGRRRRPGNGQFCCAACVLSRFGYDYERGLPWPVGGWVAAADLVVQSPEERWETKQLTENDAMQVPSLGSLFFPVGRGGILVRAMAGRDLRTSKKISIWQDKRCYAVRDRCFCSTLSFLLHYYYYYY